MAYFLVSWTILAWGLAAIYDKRAASHASPQLLASLSVLSGLLILLALFPFRRWHLFDLATPQLLIWVLLSNCLIYLAWWGYMRALQEGETSVTVAMISSYPLVSWILLISLFSQTAHLI